MRCSKGRISFKDENDRANPALIGLIFVVVVIFSFLIFGRSETTSDSKDITIAPAMP